MTNLYGISFTFCLWLFLFQGSAFAVPQKVIHLSYPETYSEIYSPLFAKVTAAFDKANIRAVFVEVPSMRGIVDMQSGSSEGEVARTQEIENMVGDKYSRIKVPLLKNDFGFYYSDKELANVNLINAKYLRLGMVRGGKISETKLQGFKNITVVSSYEALQRMLKAGRIDAYVGFLVPKHLEDVPGEVKVYFTKIESMRLYTYVRSDFKDILPVIEKAYKAPDVTSASQQKSANPKK